MERKEPGFKPTCLCHVLTSEIAPLNHVVSITLQERRLLTAVSLGLPSSLGWFQL